MLLAVNHSDDEEKILIRGKIVSCSRGESIMSLSSWCSEFGKGWTVQKVRTFFSLLENDKMITRSEVGVTTKLKVCNYDVYQKKKQPTNKKTRFSLTSLQHSLNTHITTNNKEEHLEQVKQENKIIGVIVENLASKSQGMINAYMQWFEYKVQIKDMYKSELGVNKLFKANGKFDEAEVIKSIDKSIEKGWKGLFPESDKTDEAPKQDMSKILKDYVICK
jgi:hypothetical protein